MTAEAVIAGILEREGGWRDAKARPDGSWDPATNRGITLNTLQTYGPSLIAADSGYGIERLRSLSEAEAARIYRTIFIELPGFTVENIPFEPLRVQLIDFGVNSGPERATRWLQRVCGLQATGHLNAQTIAFLNKEQWNGFERPLLALVNDALVAARVYMVDQAVDQGRLRRQDEEGLESRALRFFLARPE